MSYADEKVIDEISGSRYHVYENTLSIVFTCVIAKLGREIFQFQGDIDARQFPDPFFEESVHALLC